MIFYEKVMEGDFYMPFFHVYILDHDTNKSYSFIAGPLE